MSTIVYNMDCLEGMKQFEDKHFDLAIVDPPYGSGLGEGGGCQGRFAKYREVMVHGNPSVIEEKRLELIDKYNEKEKELEFTKLAIMQTEETLNRMPKTLRDMLIEVFVNGKTYRSVGEKYGYSYNGAWHYIKRETEKYL